ncbi:MAG: response regulator [Deltaproteobacteria bacterium]|nr:response regulator [Deltaproteobacteria bacterium]
MSQATILLVDDEPTILTALKREIGEGYKLLTADSAAAALRIVKAEHVDVVIADCYMPGTTGLQLMQELRRTHPQIVRVILTGHADKALTMRAINDGHVYRLAEKPWDSIELRAIVDDCAKEAARITGGASVDATPPPVKSVDPSRTRPS